MTREAPAFFEVDVYLSLEQFKAAKPYASEMKLPALPNRGEILVLDTESGLRRSSYRVVEVIHHLFESGAYTSPVEARRHPSVTYGLILELIDVPQNEGYGLA